MKIIRNIVMVVALILVFPWVTAVSAQGEGKISGRIENGTANGTVPSGQTISLITYLGSQESSIQETTPDIEGYYLFENLVTSSDYTYQVFTKYIDITYYSDLLQFNQDIPELSTDLRIFEVEELSESISIDACHVIIYAVDDHLHVSEFYLFRNESDRTSIGISGTGNNSIMTTLQFSLPATAHDLQPSAGFLDDEIILVDGGFSITAPVAPGMKEIAFTYTASFDAGDFLLEKEIFYPLKGMEFMVNGNNLKIDTDQMEKKDNLQIEGNTFQHYSVGEMLSGQSLRALVSQGNSANLTGMIFLVITVLVLTGGILYIAMTRRNKEPGEKSSATPDADTSDLLQKLAKLDDDFEDGIINDDEYQRLRTELKNQISESMTSTIR